MKKVLTLTLLLILSYIYLFISIYNYSTIIHNELSDHLLRFHIIANSDSIEDQNLKLIIRDKLLDYFKNSNINILNKEDCTNFIKTNSNQITSYINSIIYNEGYNYRIKTSLEHILFPTKHYSNISLPSGYYDTFNIYIGDANGQNWWCCLFPPLCFSDNNLGVIDENTSITLDENLTEEELKIMKNSTPEIKLKFKLLEYFNK